MDSSASYFLRQLPAAVLAAAALGGCSASEGAGTSELTFSEPGVPFSFRVPAEFTAAPVDELNSRGDVVALRALDKTSVIAVRRVGGRLTVRRDTRLRVLGREVTSRVIPVGRGWALECQWTADRRSRVLAACRRARTTLRFR